MTKQDKITLGSTMVGAGVTLITSPGPLGAIGTSLGLAILIGAFCWLALVSQPAD